MSSEIVPKLNVLVTGTRGRVGKAIIPGLRRVFDITELDIAFPETGGESLIHGDITEYKVVLDAVRIVKPDCIVHLAANANQNAPAEEIQAPNYQGLQNVYEAAAMCHVSKIVFASSMHTHSGHSGFPDKSSFEDGRKIDPGDPYDPGNPYGESKVWGENLAREYYDQYGLRTVVLRLGDLNAANKPAEEPYAQFAPIWLSHPDATQAFTKAILIDPPEPVSIYFVTSDNDGPYNIQPTIDELGYIPTDGIAKGKTLLV
ncbi:MAG TPA: NAD(P)-dependent oxidoreductase [Candidatus Saccharimonadales bacterium]|nr:NAD(P)-dependent oxidoreductase [Candidatus Saccharimonadales bacterium]